MASQSSKPTITTLSPQAESYQRRPIGFHTENLRQYNPTYGSIITTADSIITQLRKIRAKLITKPTIIFHRSYNASTRPPVFHAEDPVNTL
jgi:hypothetical protein